jgi:hypothetical protein
MNLFLYGEKKRNSQIIKGIFMDSNFFVHKRNTAKKTNANEPLSCDKQKNKNKKRNNNQVVEHGFNNGHQFGFNVNIRFKRHQTAFAMFPFSTENFSSICLDVTFSCRNDIFIRKQLQ